MKKLGLLVLLFASLIPAYGWGNCDTVFGVRRFVSPGYPNVAWWAQVSGDVRLLAKVGADGQVESADVLSGTPILAKYAQNNLLNWCFTGQPKGGRLEVVYHYRLQGPKIHGPAVPSVALQSPTEVVIICNPPLPEGGSPA